MKKQSTPILGLGLLLYLPLLVHSTQVVAQEIEDERGFDYNSDGHRGPNKWGDLKEEWTLCSKGRMQSPIDLSDLNVTVIPEFGDLMRSYNVCNASVKHRGHDVAENSCNTTVEGTNNVRRFNGWMQVDWDGDSGSIQINGTEYMLLQGHWHAPSEHTINGKKYNLELHMVHQNGLGEVVVIGHLYQFGEPDTFLSKILRNITSLVKNNDQSYLGLIHPDELKKGGRKYYTYMGSLTVPPCTEGVMWIIDTEMSSVSLEQVMKVRLAVHDQGEINARPVQALNEREVYRYGPTLRRRDKCD